MPTAWALPTTILLAVARRQPAPHRRRALQRLPKHRRTMLRRTATGGPRRRPETIARCSRKGTALP